MSIREKVNPKKAEYLFAVGCDSNNKVMKDQSGYFIVDEKNMRISQKFDHISQFNDGVAVFTLRDKKGIVDTCGCIVIEAKYQNIIFDSNVYRFRENDKWGLMNTYLKVICKPKYSFMERFNGRKYARIMDGLKWGAISKNGKVVISPKFSYLDDVNNEIVVAGYPGIYGAIDIHGNIKVPFTFTRVKECRESIDL